jgi:antitoxin component YwqK of YwqJK toxin-antitoxin module
MKYRLLTITLLSISLSSFAQIEREESAKYFDSKHNLYNGKYEEFYNNGNVKRVMFLKNGEQDSTTLLYFDNGKINEIRSYKNGLMHGKWETYNSKGQKLAEAWYSNDKKDGIWKIWDENGILRCEMNYSKGYRTGNWILYNEKGELLSQKQYSSKDTVP